MIVLNASEVHSIIEALEARLEWVQNDLDAAAFLDEEPYLESALRKFKELSIVVSEEK